MKLHPDHLPISMIRMKVEQSEASKRGQFFSDCCCRKKQLVLKVKPGRQAWNEFHPRAAAYIAWSFFALFWFSVYWSVGGKSLYQIAGSDQTLIRYLEQFLQRGGGERGRFLKKHEQHLEARLIGGTGKSRALFTLTRSNQVRVLFSHRSEEEKTVPIHNSGGGIDQ